jgi:transglutaminase-like putative cysteine protease
MRIRISHVTTYQFERPPNIVTQTLRLTPRNHNSQYVVNWRIDVSDDCRLYPHEDAFGNLTHNFTAEGPLTELAVGVEGLVETQDTNGVVTGTIERFPPSLFLRDTPLTTPDAAITAFAEEIRSTHGNGDTLKVLHTLAKAVHREMSFDVKPTEATTTAGEAFALKRGVCQDLSHVFIACSRILGVPSRYIGGYFFRTDGVTAQDAGHAWAESYIDGLGWVAFDPTNGISATEAHVRVAVGLDYLGAAPVRGTRIGGGGESLKVAIMVEQARQQMQT